MAVPESETRSDSVSDPAGDRRFPGTWEWLGLATQGKSAILVHLKNERRRPRPRVVSCTSFELHAPFSGTRLVMAQLRAVIHASASRRAPLALVLGENNYEVVQIEEPQLTDVSEQQYRDALRWAAQELVDFPVENASLDVISGASGTGGAGARQVLAAVASAAVIEPLVREAYLGKLDLVALDVRETAQRNVAHLFEQPGKALGLLSVVGGRALLTISVDGHLLMTRRIDTVREGEDLCQAVQEDEHVRDRIGLEVQRTLDNFERQSGRLGVQRLLIGPGTHAAVLADHLATLLGMQVETLSATDLQAALEFDFDVQAQYRTWTGLHILALGAALRGER